MFFSLAKEVGLDKAKIKKQFFKANALKTQRVVSTEKAALNVLPHQQEYHNHGRLSNHHAQMSASWLAGVVLFL